MNPKMKILFVDDETRILDGIRRMLRSKRDEWDLYFAESGNDALSMLATETIDVIVSDIRMPGMTGTQLLEKVKSQYPGIVRIALSGESDKEMIFKSVGPIHQYLSKPCDSEQLIKTIVRTCALRGLLENAEIMRAVSSLESLPSPPAHYEKLLRELESPNASIKRIESIISSDFAMSVKILQLVNSAFFGVGRTISNPYHAIMLLGLETVKKLFLVSNVFSQFEKIDSNILNYSKLWEHSLFIGTAAKKIASSQNVDDKSLNDFFMAGLLHDIGKLVLACKIPDKYRMAVNYAGLEKINLTDAEKQVMGCTHAEIGGYLLGLWGLNDAIVEAVAFHHNPDRAATSGFSALSAVYFAHHAQNILESLNDANHESIPDYEFVRGQDVQQKIPEWAGILSELSERNP